MRPAAAGRRAAWLLAALTVAPGLGLAYPEGAPWGASDPDAAENCESCHFDYPPVRASGALSVEGLPQKATPGETYRLTVRFREADAVIAGFQMIARIADDPAGDFESSQARVEYVGAAIRSTEPLPASESFEWVMSWTAPDSPGATVTVFVAAMRANDDGSPFGDQAHFRSYVVEL
jgi:hypothetical protein